MQYPREHYGVVNHNDAIEFVENLVKPSYVLRELDILSVHQLVMDKLNKEFSGRIRNADVRITGAYFTPPNALKVSDLLIELISWVRKEGNGLHPIIRAALFHHILVWIHPFFGGNGRTARLVYNMLLIKEGFPPAIILKVDRKK